jgi:hypothetical protein
MTPREKYKHNCGLSRRQQKIDTITRSWKRSSIYKNLMKEREARLRTLSNQIHAEIEEIKRAKEKKNEENSVGPRSEETPRKKSPSIILYKFFNDGKTKPRFGDLIMGLESPD